MRVAGNLMMSCLAAIATDGEGSDVDMDPMVDASAQVRVAISQGPTIRNPLSASLSSLAESLSDGMSARHEMRHRTPCGEWSC